MQVLARVLGLCLAISLAGCGGGGNDDPPPPPPPPAPVISYTAPAPYTLGTAITALAPTVTGSVSSFSVTPTLPAGLTLNTASGTISGTPTAIAAQANYTVTASNGTGSGSTPVTITVNDVAPDVGYAQSTFSLTTGSAVNLLPSSTAGAVVTWSINPALPAGLALNATTGAITGTPTAIAASAGHVVTGTNSGGSDTFALSIAVEDGLLLPLGHNFAIKELHFEGNRILSFGDDNGYRAVLWNAQTGAILADDLGVCQNTMSCGRLSFTALHGPTMVVRRESEFTVRSSVDGSVVATIADVASGGSWWQLSSDGNYIVQASATSLTFWSRAGARLFSRDGDFRQMKAFAAAGELRLTTGPVGATMIEKIAVPSGTSTLSAPFSGNFAGWFLDGESFFATVGNVVTVFSKDAVQIGIAALPDTTGLAGKGNRYWTVRPNALSIYSAGGDATPLATYPLVSDDVVTPSGSTLGLYNQYAGGQLSVIDLSSATPTRADYVSPIEEIDVYAAVSSAEWAFSAGAGVLMGELNNGAPQQYNVGNALSLAGSTAHIAVATGNHQIHYFDTNTRAKLGTIDYNTRQIALSTDGRLLAAMGAGFDRSIRFYSLPSGTLLDTWAYTSDIAQTRPLDFRLSPSGNLIALQLITPVTFARVLEVRRTGTRSLLLSGQMEFPAYTSPDDAAIAVTAGSRTDAGGTQVFNDSGAATSAFLGRAIEWLDDSRILAAFYNRPLSNSTTPQYASTKVLSTSGAALFAPTLPELRLVQVLSASTVYAPEYNKIFNVETGATLWSSATPAYGTGTWAVTKTSDSVPVPVIAGPFVVYLAKQTVPAAVRVESR